MAAHNLIHVNLSITTQWAKYVLLRLPGSVEPLFSDWLDQNFPNKKNKVVNAIGLVRAGSMNDTSFESRMRGTGKSAKMINTFFNLCLRRHGYKDNIPPPLDTSQFRIPNIRLLTCLRWQLPLYLLPSVAPGPEHFHPSQIRNQSCLPMVSDQAMF
jgi:hypothetical protein